MSETARKASAQASSAYDPQSAYAQAQGARYVAKRSCTVLKPASYGEVEKIARALKGGDAVILALRNTPDSLSKRILDFSFGVSSALDAGVECVGDKVFAITKGDALTDAEKLALRNQGVL
jgi:cell division inhibitor SepF